MNLKEACDLASEINADTRFLATLIVAIGAAKERTTYSVQATLLSGKEGPWWIRERVDWEELLSTFPPA